MNNLTLDNGAYVLLTGRSERPIEGCELQPNIFLQIKGGFYDNSTRAKLLESNPHYYVYNWSSGSKTQICACISCPRGDNFDPINWSKAALGGPELICSVCERNGLSIYDSMFCSLRFFEYFVFSLSV
jgi:hypothetical protein